MKPFTHCVALALLLGAAGLASARLASADGLDSNPYSNPYNSPVKRANPNSRQGTVPSTPSLPGPLTAPVVRPPTLENGGIGNGYPSRQPAPVRPVLDPRSSPPPRGN